MNKNLTKEFNAQCQSCLKSKSEGATLFRCGGCKNQFFRSRECQREAWPMHKERCRQLQDTLANQSRTLTAKFESLRAFATKHRPALATMGIVGLRLKDDPENAWNLEQFVWITVRERPEATRAELAWEALKVEVVPWSVLPAEQAEGLQSHLRQLEAFLGGKVEGMDGGFNVLLRDVDSEACGGSPITYEKGTLYSAPPGAELTWKENLMTLLNEGRVVRI